MTERDYPGERHLAFWKEHLAEPHFVYVIQGDPETHVKVGMARDPIARMRGLQTGNPQRLRLLYVLPGALALERALHARFGVRWLSSKIKESEWFRWSQETQLGLKLIETAAADLVESYDGSGRMPIPPRFDGRSDEEVDEARRTIERFTIDGYERDFIADQLGWRYAELDLELERMRMLGDYHCFLPTSNFMNA